MAESVITVEEVQKRIEALQKKKAEDTAAFERYAQQAYQVQIAAPYDLAIEALKSLLPAEKSE